MSGIDQRIIGTEDPEYYAELFSPRLENRRLPSADERSRVVPGIRSIDGPFARRLQTLLDAVANISLCQRGNVAATMACLKDDKGTLETRLYIVFNHDDESALRCPQHLQVVFNMLRQVPYKAINGSPKVITNDLENDLIEICRVIHNYSFDIFARRVNKHAHKLSDIRGYIEQDRTHFKPGERSTLLEFLDDVNTIIKHVTNAQTTKQLPTISIKMLLKMYSYWTRHNLLPEDDHNVTLLDQADVWLANEHRTPFQLRRWALKIMSLLILTYSLFSLTQSSRLRRIIQGRFSVQVLPSPTTAPYFCDLSSETIQVALDAALAEANYDSVEDGDRDSFIELLLEKLKVSEVVRWEPTVHAELAMIIAMAKDEVKDILPYVGVSKLSCVMCNHYIGAFNEVTKQKITIKGCHGKAYPGWFWPSLPGHDEKLRPVFLGRMRKQLYNDFIQHAEGRQLSDSTTGSGALRLEDDATRKEIEELKRAELPAQ